MRKRSKYRPKGIIENPLSYVLESVKTVASHSSYLLDLRIKNSAAMASLMQGKADKADIDVLVAMSNIVEALYLLGFGKEYGEVAIGGREAILRIVHRAVEIKRFTPTAADIAALNDLMELHDAQMDVITIGDMERALQLARKRLANKKATLLPAVMLSNA